jgi:hypothetical protein
MARAVRFTKPERELIKEALGLYTPGDRRIGAIVTTKGKTAAAESALEKLIASEKPEPPKLKAKLTLQAALEIFRGALGARLVLPPIGADGMYGAMQRRLTALQLDAEQCRAIAVQAGAEWAGRIKASSILNQAEVLLVQHASYEAEQEHPNGALDVMDEL